MHTGLKKSPAAKCHSSHHQIFTSARIKMTKNDTVENLQALKIQEYSEEAQPQGTVKLSAIQNIAQHVQPPKVTAQRPTPLTNHLKRSDPFQFGSRYLEETDDVFAWNAWDHVDPSKDPIFVSYAEEQYSLQKENAVSDFDRERFNKDPEKWWNKFYGNNAANFFKDRKWLRQEFPVLSVATTADLKEAEARMIEVGASQESAHEALKTVKNGPWNTILEVGAGAGNTAFPLARNNRNPNLMIHACDFSAKAVQLIRQSAEYDPKHLTASQWDMASLELPDSIAPGSVDIVIMVFAFSALAPSQWAQAVRNVWKALRPGGEVCFRDYGRGDLAQVRFRKGRLMSENFYVRGDGTRVYFFEEDELRDIWGGAAKASGTGTEAQTVLPGSSYDANLPQQNLDNNSAFKFDIVSLGTDRRLLVNRQKQLKMYRCWQQGLFKKPNP